MKKAWLVAVLVGGVLGGAPPKAGASASAWEYAASIPSARSIPVYGVIDGLGYVASGRVANSDCTYSASLQIYDPVNDSWSSGPSMSTNREGAAGAVIGDTLYVVGGANGCGSYLASVESYDASTGGWTTRASLASPRYGATAAAHGGKLYVFGGYYAPLGLLQSAEVYDPDSDSWAPIATPPRKRFTGSSVTVGDRIYLLAGADEVTAYVDVDVYDPTTDSWSTGPSLPYGIVAAGATAHGGTVHFAGGAFSNTVYARTWHLDLATDTWVEDAALNTPRLGLSLFSLDGSLVAASGQNLSTMTTAVEHYEPASSNEAPVADAGADVTVPCAPSSGASVSLDGTGSVDADADELAYSWSATGVAFDDPSSPMPSATFPVGSTTVTLEVDDGTTTDTDTVVVVVEADPPPTITAPADVTVEATGPSGQAVALGTPAASDACGTPVVTNDAPSLFALGTTVVTWTATDANGSTATDTQSVTVVDTTAPTLSVSGLPATIKKDKKELVEVTATVSATDLVDTAPAVSVAVTCNVTLAPGDVVVNSPTSVELNAENGRVYTFTWTATDDSGNTSTASGTVTVTASGK